MSRDIVLCFVRMVSKSDVAKRARIAKPLGKALNVQVILFLFAILGE